MGTTVDIHVRTSSYESPGAPTVSTRAYRDGDLPEILRLINDTDDVERLDRSMSERELRGEIDQPGFDPSRDLVVAETPGGRLVGEAELYLRRDDQAALFMTWGTVHPEWRRRGIGRRLMDELWSRAIRRAAEAGLSQAQFRATCLAGLEPGRQALFERLGMTQVRVFYRMVFESLDAGLPEPQLPPGIVIRRYVPGQDDVAWLAAANEVFRDHWGHVDRPLESWLHTVRSERFRPDISLIAMDGDQIAGVCHNEIPGDKIRRTGRKRGLVATLGVRRPWRGRGVGTALLIASLRVLSDAGMESAELGVDAQNLTGAVGLYERVGFRVSRIWLSFGKPLPSNAVERSNVTTWNRSNASRRIP